MFAGLEPQFIFCGSYVESHSPFVGKEVKLFTCYSFCGTLTYLCDLFIKIALLKHDSSKAYNDCDTEGINHKVVFT